MTIYDYDNKAVEVELPDKEIDYIVVEVLSGDETGFVQFTDGTYLNFDASNDRFVHYADGWYRVPKEHVRDWMNFKPSKEMTISYDRQKWANNLEGSFL